MSDIWPKKLCNLDRLGLKSPFAFAVKIIASITTFDCFHAGGQNSAGYQEGALSFNPSKQTLISQQRDLLLRWARTICVDTNATFLIRSDHVIGTVAECRRRIGEKFSLGGDVVIWG